MAVHIVFSNLKGGVGKTMTLFQMAGFLSDRGYTILCIDYDPQGNLTKAFLPKKPSKTISDLIEGRDSFRNIIVQPYPKVKALQNIVLLPTDYELYYTGLNKKENLLLRDIIPKEVESAFDFVFVDTNPSITENTVSALVYADYILGVLDTSIDAIEGFNYLQNSVISVIQQKQNPNLEIIGILLNASDRRTNLFRDVQKVLKKQYKNKLFETVIPDTVKLKESRTMKMPIIVYDRNSNIADYYAQLTGEFLKRLGGQIDHGK